MLPSVPGDGVLPMPVIHYPPDLPITARRDEIVATIAKHQVVVLAGETGSGKTTQLPKMCHEALAGARGRIGCTQPRRVAAMSVSRRVAEEMGVIWGREVGCKMRFQDDTGRDTRIKFMTDGILLAEIQSDPLLRSYSALILDEAHERSLNIDFLLGYLHDLLPRRPDLKLLITSATIDTSAFSAHFGNAPIIEVSGRLYPVEIRYAPPEKEAEDLGLLEAAANAVEDLLLETHDGDVLVFMPTERDIRETCDLLEGRLGGGTEVLGLFGRMPAGEQQRVFEPGPRRRVIVATNVAETSITLPRIRAVVDTGLARMSRYNTRNRTKRLPIEDISQSSANQRAGRAGRLRDGVCVRLWAEGEFAKRPPFTTPEIQRSNLAEVILRMKAFQLGEIETFPFLNPPAPAAIRAGYQLLHELGCLDDLHDMTPLGRDLARLPVDPTLGRMLLQARREDCLPEMLIIAAGLSVPDPRERPDDAKEKAAQAHRAWHCPESDFLSLLRLWEAAPDPTNQTTGNALRRFCKANYLSIVRMREWRDVWRQLREALRESGDLPQNHQDQTNRENAIHRCILTGQLGHIARREERNTYLAGGNRLIQLHPGSNLYERRVSSGKKKIAATPSTQEKKPRQPAWIVAGEIVHTSQLFARTVARIDPLWIAELGAHLCQVTHSEPRWDSRTGRVLCWERTLLHGLEVNREAIDFGKVDPQKATRLFIQHALVEGDATITHAFHAKNRQLVERLRAILSRIRSRRVLALEDRLQAFYEGKLEAVSSVHDLNRFLKARSAGEPEFLFASEEDLADPEAEAWDAALFPDEVNLGNSVLPVSYAYAPGAEEDGVTVQVPLPMVEHLSPAQVQWMVPGLRESQIEELLRSLPKSLRKKLQPIDSKAREIAREFLPGRGPFLTALAAHVTQRYGVALGSSDWTETRLPAHLQPRVEVLGSKNQLLACGRDLEVLREAMKPKTKAVNTDAWDRAVRHWERHGLSSWSFGNLPETVDIEEIAGQKVQGFPGLAVTREGISVRLFRSREEVENSTPAAVRQLAEARLGRDIAWLKKELRSLAPLGEDGIKPKAAPAADFRSALTHIGRQITSPPVTNLPPDNKPFPDQAVEHLLRHSLALEPLHPLRSDRFEALCDDVRRKLPALAHRLQDLLKQIGTARHEILSKPNRYPGLESDLRRLLPPDLLSRTPHGQLAQVPRFLKAIKIRAERAALHPGKDAEKARLVAAVTGWEDRLPARRQETYRWMLEEYRVSVFAPELGTVQPVSVKRLEALLET